MENKYYVYRHIRLDKNEVFYVGIGTIININSKVHAHIYNRAFTYSGKSRNTHWKRIYKKTKIKTEILFESDNRDTIVEKEIEFIALYGRRDLGLGTLVNMTDGGDGITGHKHSQETRLKQQSAIRKPIFVYSLKGVFLGTFNNYVEAAKFLNETHAKISNWMQKTPKIPKYVFFKNFQGNAIEKYCNHIVQYDSFGNIIATFKSVVEAATSIKVNSSAIYVALINKNAKCKGYYWRYKKDTFQKEDVVPHKNKRQRAVYVYDLEGKFLFTEPLEQVCKTLNLKRGLLQEKLVSKKLYYKGYFFSYNYYKEGINEKIKQQFHKLPKFKYIFKLDKNNIIIEKYRTFKIAAIVNNVSLQTIMNRCKNSHILYEEYYWKVEDCFS